MLFRKQIIKCLLISSGITMAHDDIIRWKHFPRYWPSVKGIHQSPGYPSQRPLTRSFDVFFMCAKLNKRPSKRSRCRWFETPCCSLWRHYCCGTNWLGSRCCTRLISVYMEILSIGFAQMREIWIYYIFKCMQVFVFGFIFHWLKFDSKDPFDNISAVDQVMAWQQCDRT